MPKKAAPSAKSTLTKSDLIRSMPTAPAAAIIAKAKTHGMKLTANHVYAVRAIDKRRSANKKANAAAKPAAAAPAVTAAPKGRRGRPPKRATSNGGGAHEANFMAIVLDIGLAKAESLLHRVRERVKDL
jgi:hypothetical protein